MNNLPEGYKFKKENFQILHAIGHGGQCIVYLAENEKKEKFAIKQLTVSHDDPLIKEQIKMFRREYKLLSILKHRLLPKGYKYFKEDDEHFIVVEYVPGKNLDEILHIMNKPLEEDIVIEIALQISELLVYLSSGEKPVILRDIKPSNMIITHSGEVKFIDFSIARKHNKRDDTVRLGSPGYAPPEQYRGHSDVKSDIYALGITMYELLTMKDPSLDQKDFFSIKTVDTKYKQLSEIVEISTKLNQEERYNPEELNLILKKLYKEKIKDKSGLKKLAKHIYNINLPDTIKEVIPEESEKKLFLKFQIEDANKDLFSNIELIIIMLLVFIIMCLIMYISKIAGMVYFFTTPLWLPRVIYFIGIDTYKYLLTDEYMEFKASLFKKNLLSKTKIYWSKIKKLEERKFKHKPDKNKYIYIITNDNMEAMIFPPVCGYGEETKVKKLISIIEEKSHIKLKEVWR